MAAGVDRRWRSRNTSLAVRVVSSSLPLGGVSDSFIVLFLVVARLVGAVPHARGLFKTNVAAHILGDTDDV